MMRHLLVTLWLEQAISDKAEYRVNHDATFILATFDSYIQDKDLKEDVHKQEHLPAFKYL